ncbi:MAG: CRISPR-associated endonuclease Cas1 [Candidatus Hadarchaeum sp.]|uniref:CRISPR-associated endonuclease Cas1 n=1 Tax=Candidatus Hadarchaeum sp. TaxID=2883567 RepID=UPI0031719709
MRLVIDGFGKFLGVKGETLVVKETGNTLQRISPQELDQVIISGKGSVSTDALQLLAKHGVDVLIVDFRGEVQARLSSPMMRTVSTRREQYYAFQDHRGIQIAKAIVEAKIKNQAATLATLSKARKDTDQDLAAALYQSAQDMKKFAEQVTSVAETSLDLGRNLLMNLEGQAAKLYWEALAKLFGPEWHFEGRSGRYATDPINAMLNYGYGVLFGETWRAVHYAGLDPYGGFLHADRPGKASMVLDLMEEFRAQVVDKQVVKFVTKRIVTPASFELIDGVCQMRDVVRKLYLSEILEKLEDEVRFGEMKLSWSELILFQARQLAKYLRGEISSYEGFWQRW